MFFKHLLNAVLAKRATSRMSGPRPSTRLRLEELEDRLTPSPVSAPIATPTPIFAATATNASVQVTPNLAAGTVTEKVTVSVTTTPQFNSSNGQIIPVPAGAGTPSGKVFVNLNNQQQSQTLDSKGDATFTFTLPILSVLSSQSLAVEYTGSFNSSSSNEYGFSAFSAPLYMNYDNLFLPATLTFGQLTPQQQASSFNSSGQQVGLPPYSTAQGETDNFGLFSCQYGDPGVINNVDVLGFQLPGMVAMELGVYGPSTANANG
ncbi:MAG TPA: hypothetical protein VH643_36155 [Gemmataceae bacterium]